ncbi:uncharacterized protein LOC129591552 [Paramacrobiotus metropolitanus]|uniref:uncharacterized protein LOC129591552 n=1 Tax=Paramacrobiotus metropolitanus TaxID=2943436 RepID=UPI0024460D64|nr:uncharacterized protein LOC129591552 [Paramacrobiotus metropolitanus]
MLKHPNDLEMFAEMKVLLGASRWTFPAIFTLLPLKRTLFFIVCLWDATQIAGFGNECPANAMARYKMELRGTWMEPTLNKRLLPGGFPERWVWSNGIGVSLDAREDPYYNETIKSKFYNFVRKGGLAQTISELNRFGSGVLDTFIIPATASTGGDSTSVFFVDSNHSRISFMSRMNQKPHWILSVDSVNLCHKGRFRDAYELDLFPSESKFFRQDTSKSAVGHPPKRHPTNPRGNAGPRHAQSPGNPNTYYTGQGQSIVSPKFFRPHPTATHHIVNTTKPPQTLVTPLHHPHSAVYVTSSTKTTTTEPVYLYSNEIDHGPIFKRQHKASAATDPEMTRKRTTERPYWQSTDTPRKKPVVHKPGHRRNDQTPGKDNTHKTQHTNKRASHGSPDSVPPPAVLAVMARSVRAANYGPQQNYRYPQGYQRSVRYDARNYPHPPAHYIHPGQNRNHQEQQQHLPDALPRLATVRFVKIATYHLSHLPPAISRRKPRIAHQAPLPITVHKSLLKSQYLPYRGLSRTAAQSPPVVMQHSPQRYHTPGYGYSPSQAVQQALAPVQTFRPRDTYAHRVGYT